MRAASLPSDARLPTFPVVSRCWKIVCQDQAAESLRALSHRPARFLSTFPSFGGDRVRKREERAIGGLTEAVCSLLLSECRTHYRERRTHRSDWPRTPARKTAFRPKLPCHPVCRSRSAMLPGARRDAASSTRRAAARPSGRTAPRRQRSPRW